MTTAIDDEAAELVPIVLVSSRDGAPVPHVAGAVKLAEAAQRHGWTARQTYALASIPERHYLNGNLAKPAHLLASVVVRLSRGGVTGFAAWRNEDDQGWRFTHAYIRAERFGARSIVERLEKGQSE